MSSVKRKPGQRSARVEQKRQRNRREILAAAEALLRHGGVDAVTLGSVAGELALTKQALYHYFPSKEALIKNLVVKLLDDEIETLIAAVEKEKSSKRVLGSMIRAFYNHYINHLDAFRAIYCASQLYQSESGLIDEDMLRDEINPRTRGLFDILEDRLSKPSMTKKARAGCRRLAYSAWLAALGLITMLAVADAANDPLIHTDQELVDSLAEVFDAQTQ